MGVDQGGSDLDEVTYRGDAAAGYQIGRVGGLARVVVRGASGNGQADAREQQGSLVLVAGDIHLHAVEARLLEGHRGQRSADLIADGDRVEVLTLRIGVDSKGAEPLVELRILVDGRAKLHGLALAPVVDKPAAGKVVTVEIVERLTLDERVDVTLVRLTAVVGILIRHVAVVDEQFLWDVPLTQGWVEGVEQHAGAAGCVGNLATPVVAQAIVTLLGVAGAGTNQRDEEEVARAGARSRPEAPSSSRFAHCFPPKRTSKPRRTRIARVRVQYASATDIATRASLESLSRSMRTM